MFLLYKNSFGFINPKEKTCDAELNEFYFTCAETKNTSSA